LVEDDRLYKHGTSSRGDLSKMGGQISVGHVHNITGSNGMCCNDFNLCCSLDDFGHSDGVSHESILDYVGSGLHSTRVLSLEKTMDSAMANLMLDEKREKKAVDFHERMREVSPMKINGESLVSSKKFSNFGTSSVSLSEIENERVSHFPSTEEVIAFGGIPKPSNGLRSSSRLGSQPNADMPQLEKAMKNAQSRDECSNIGQSSNPSFSIVNIPESEIIKRAHRLGISLGNSTGEIHKSINGIKLVEEERILTILKKKDIENENKEEGLETLVLSKVSTLCEDLIEDEDIPLDFDDHLEHLKPLVKVKKTRQRKVYDSSNIRKSTRKRIKKQFS
jgi:hypothetical protein